MVRYIATIIITLIYSTLTTAQQESDLLATTADSIRGSITPEREWWNVVYYDITVKPHIANKSISGVNNMRFTATNPAKRMQVDLQMPMKLDSALFEGKLLTTARNGNAYYIDFPQPLRKGAEYSIKLVFSGSPKQAINPPWDGGWIWSTDGFGNPWITVACQGLGASVWYPCKDHLSDEPDSASLTIIVPHGLQGIGNGKLMSQKKLGDERAYTWKISNPINSYNIVPYIGKYVHWSDSYSGEQGRLDLDYWVLEENVKAAKKQFGQVKPMLKCFEHWFGAYPFYEDGFKLVETPHLGMEHQSGIAYGNKFQNGYLGKDLSGTGWGRKWDFIIIHESGHEWFGNNITVSDIADMWVHEGFTNYSEAIYTGCEYGKAAGNEYVIGLRKNIQNDKPLIGEYGVNREGSVDMYYKGSNLVHMIRQIMNNDEAFRQMLRSMNKDFYHQVVTSQQIEQYINGKVGKDLSKIFNQYLRTTQIPVFEYSIKDGTLRYRWTNAVDGFDMPLKIGTGDSSIWISPTTNWKEMKSPADRITIDPNFYISSRQL